MRPRKILCIRLSALGDVLMTTPVLRALHQQLGAEVHVLTKPAPALMLQHNPHVHRVIEWGSPGLLASLRQESYDLIVDLHCNLRSHRLRLALGVPTVGFRKRNFAKWLLTKGKDYLGGEHLVDRYFRALKPLGLQLRNRQLDYFVTQEEQHAAQEVLAGFGESCETPVALVLGATHATKRMPAALIVEIIEGLGQPMVLLGGDDVRALANEVLQQSRRSGGGEPPSVYNLVGKLSLRGSCALLAECRAVVTPDTGLMHVAAALSVPMVVVWGNTVPAFGMYPFVEEDQVNHVAYAEVEGLSCRPCSRIGYAECPKVHFRCMRSQSAEIIERQASAVQRVSTVS